MTFRNYGNLSSRIKKKKLKYTSRVLEQTYKIIIMQQKYILNTEISRPNL